jgi:dihydroorotate dehydrogenase electron transfer subunit
MNPTNVVFVSAEVLANEDLGAGCWLLRLAVDPELDASAVQPGQFVMLRGPWAHHPMLPRPFSVLDTAEGQLEILVKVVGRGTTLIAGLHQGAPVTVLGPLGRPFEPPTPGVRDLLAGGGSGIPPLYLHALRAPPGSEVELLYGGRSGADLVLSDRIVAAGLTLHRCTEDGSVGSQGRVTDLLEERLDVAGDHRVLACGPTPMLKAIATLCEARGVACWFSLETEMACGIGICRGCSVAHPEGGWRCTCTDGPVFEAGEVVL